MGLVKWSDLVDLPIVHICTELVEQGVHRGPGGRWAGGAIGARVPIRH